MSTEPDEFLMSTIYLFTIIVLASHSFLFISCNQFPRISLDYKKLCEENLPSCQYVTLKLPVVTKESLASLLDPLSNQYNNTIIEIATTQKISEFEKALDTFLTVRPQWLVREQPLQISNVVEQSIILQKLPSELEPSYSYISEVNFPKDLARFIAYLSYYLLSTYLHLQLRYSWILSQLY